MVDMIQYTGFDIGQGGRIPKCYIVLFKLLIFIKQSFPR